MNLLKNLFLSTTAIVGDTSDVISITTEYADTKFPSLSLFTLSFSIVLLIAVVVAGFIFIRKYFRGWGYSLAAGFTAYLLFGYVLYMLCQLGLSYIPGFDTWKDENTLLFTVILTLLSVIMEVAGVYLGMLYIVRNSEKKGQTLDMGAAFAFGLAYYAAAFVASKQISYFFQYVMIGYSINVNGFDSVASQLVASLMSSDGMTKEAATESAVSALSSMVNQNSFDYLFDTLEYVLLGAASTIAAVIFYGCMKERLEKKWSLFAVAALVAFGLPNIISTAFELSVGVNLLMGIVIVFAMYVYMVRIAKTYMPEELARVKEQKKTREDAKKHVQKMPKIKMPD